MDPKKPCFRRLAGLGLLVTALLFLTACGSNQSSSPQVLSTLVFSTQTGQLTPYQTQPGRNATTPSPDPARLATATPLPSFTPTPRTHEVKKGEDMGGIAWNYRVSLEELIAANPTIQPNMMSVGTLLIIPPSKTQLPPGENPTPPTPTPAAVSAGKLTCTRVEDGGMWCFMPVQNGQAYFLEGLSAVFRVSGQAADAAAELPQVLSQIAYLPLDRLPPGASLPLAAYFPPEQIAAIAAPYQFSSELLTALPGAEDGRYVPMHVENQKVLLAENGRSAQVSAEAVPDSTGNARRVWAAAIAYDAKNNVVGVRRWERQDTQPLEDGQVSGITMWVYSVSAEIERVEIYVEARP